MLDSHHVAHGQLAAAATCLLRGLLLLLILLVVRQRNHAPVLAQDDA